MNEAKLKGDLCSLIRVRRPAYKVLRIEDHFTHGIPDISIDGNKRHSWWEAKYGVPNFKCKGIQQLTGQQLALADYMRFVVYWQPSKESTERRTYIVHPNDIKLDHTTWKDFTNGFNHQWVMERILEVHNDHQR